LKGAGNKAVIQEIVSTLERHFGSIKLKEKEFEHCGVWHLQDDDFTVRTHQHHYAAQLKPVDCSYFKSDTLQQELNDKEHATFLTLLGALAWLVQTRMDIAVYVTALQRQCKTPRREHLQKANRVLKWVKRRRVDMNFMQIRLPARLIAISDSAFRAEEPDGLAMRGAVYAIGEKHEHHPGGRLQILEFAARKQKRVTRSTFSAELNGLGDTTEFATLLVYALSEIMLGGPDITSIRTRADNGTLPIDLETVIDARGVYTALRVLDTKIPSEGSLLLVLLQLKESLRRGSMRKLWWCDTIDMLADGLTKGSISREALIQVSKTGIWNLIHDALSHTDRP